jgi:hypothetical protein
MKKPEPMSVSKALRSLDRLSEQSRQAARTASSPMTVPTPSASSSTAAVPALESDPHAAQDRREGSALLAAMYRAGVTGQQWHSAGDLTGGSHDR